VDGTQSQTQGLHDATLDYHTNELAAYNPSTSQQPRRTENFLNNPDDIFDLEHLDDYAERERERDDFNQEQATSKNNRK